ncbi:MAG: YraN family protein [Chloroflexi bacterium]|nr:YraN family protein [Chloroflexota bacterium]
MTTYARRLGQRGEARACRTLLERGAQILARNVRTPYGELDIGARQGEVLIIVEVKARTSRTFGPPEESLAATKQAHLIASAQHYLAASEHLEADWRIDAVAIEFGPGGETARLEIIENAVRGDRPAAAHPADA